MKPRIFIGSSSEGLTSAMPVHKLLSGMGYDATIWNDGEVFGFNISYLDSLLKAGSMFDFGILVATKDDLANVRQNEYKAPRDNVIFEFGLFMGRLGKFRTLILLEEGAKLPSDMEGIHILKFTASKKMGEPSESLIIQVANIIKHIEEKHKQPQLGLLASTSIAMGFYNNFIERICNYLRNKKDETISGERYTSFEVQVAFPERLQVNMQNSADDYFNNNGFKKYAFETNNGRPIVSRIAPDKDNTGKLLICDIPTTLSSLYESIKMYLPDDGFGISKEFEMIEAREMGNFIAVLEAKVNRDPFSKRIVKFINYKF